VTPTLPERVAQVTVEVALNGQQFTSEGARYNVTPHPGMPPLVMPSRGAWGEWGERGVLLSFLPFDPNRYEPTFAVHGPLDEDEDEAEAE
jgi:hypothetical protein